MQPKAFRIVLVLMALGVNLGVANLIVTKAAAGHRCCEHCGVTNSCCKVCRLVKEEKKVEVVCWGEKHEDFCIPNPSKPGCQHCEPVCQPDEESAKAKVCPQPKRFVWTEWFPTCATQHSKTKLMKKIVVKKIPSFKWVIEDMCGDCKSKCAKVEVPEGVKLPPKPVEAANYEVVE